VFPEAGKTMIVSSFGRYLSQTAHDHESARWEEAHVYESERAYLQDVLEAYR